MVGTDSILLRGIKGTAIMIEHVKRTRKDSGFLLIVFLVLNVFIFLPFLSFVGLSLALLEP